MKEYSAQEKRLIKWGLVVLALACFVGAALILKNANYQGRLQIDSMVGSFVVALFGVLFIYPVFGLDRHLKQHELSKQKGVKNQKFPKGLKVFFLLLWSVILLLLNWSAFQDVDSSSRQEGQCARIQGVLSKDIEYLKSSKGAPSLRLWLQEFPDLTFKTNFAREFSYIEKRLSKGDSVEVLLDKNEVAQWISKTHEKDFWNEYGNRGFLEMYGLRDARYVYFGLARYNELDRNDANLNVAIVIVFDLLAVILAVYFVRKKRRSSSRINS